MNKIETLIKELCPNGVEWKELGNICTVKTGKGINKNFIQANPGEFPVVNSGKDPLGFVNIFNTVDDPIGITSRGAGVGYVSWNEGNYFRGNLNYSATIKDKSKLSARFLYFYLKNNSVEIEKLCTFNGIPALNKENLEKLTIPIPPLEIQEEIVKILDKFTDYVTELTTELTLRQKQYNYYRDKLFTFEGEEVEWKTLGEIATIQRGASPRPISKFLTDNEDGVPWIKIGDTNVNSKFVENTNQKITKEGAKKSRLLKKGDFILSNSMSFGRPYILKIDGAIHDGWASISDFEDFVISDYLYHYLVLNKTQQYWASKINSGSVSNLNSEIIKSLNVPIPSFEVQLKIVKFLDYFNELTSNLSEGLPKEIGLRQKQYEYYRDKLLSFD